MKPTDHPDPEDPRRAGRDGQERHEPLVLLDEGFAPTTGTGTATVLHAWLVWNCTDLVGVYATEAEALEVQADLRQQILCDYGQDLELQDSITIGTATLQPLGTTPTGAHR